MRRLSLIAAGAALAFSLAGVASAEQSSDSAAAAQHRKLVTSVQAKLGVPANGQMTPQTEEAIKHFQRVKGLEATGQLDKGTLRALGLAGPKPKPAAAGASAKGEPTTPIGPRQPSEERAAEPTNPHDAPTGTSR
jgi:peptidoglycan hydrolase-like protein with peptidoglycan-binding domain